MQPSEMATVPVRPVDTAMRVCGSCGGSSDAERELCATCGADLDTGLPIEIVALRLGDGGPVRRRGLLVGLAVMAGVVLTVGLVELLTSGSTQASDRLDPVPFVPSSYPATPELLSIGSVATTTTAELGDGEVSPLALIDGDGATAWVGMPPEEDGAVETIQLILARPAWVTRIQVRNGDHRSPTDYERSARLQQVVLIVDGGRDHRVDLLDIGRQAQVVELRVPELTTRVTIRVERTFPGLDSDGVALSELSLVGWPANATDAAVALERAARP
jgi:hypothetical protein